MISRVQRLFYSNVWCFDDCSKIIVFLSSQAQVLLEATGSQSIMKVDKSDFELLVFQTRKNLPSGCDRIHVVILGKGKFELE